MKGDKKGERDNIKKDYVVVPFTITNDNIDSFIITLYRRQISNIHVQKIHGALLEGKNPIGVLIVNHIDNKMRLIDGNHRLEAIKKFYNYKDSFKLISIECVLKKYEGLSEEEEKKIYSDEAKRRNESYEDRLNIYKDTIVFWKVLTNPANHFPCPVTIYPSKEGLKFRLILNAMYISKGDSSKGYLPSYLSKEELIDFANTLNFDNYLLIKEFMTFFIGVFGEIGDGNMFARAHFFLPLFDIYCKNRVHKEDKIFNERFSRVLGKHDLMQYINMSGREVQLRIRYMMVDHMNYRIGKNLFI